LAKLPYHSGQSADLVAVLEHIARECPASPATLVGFSLSGNITLKLLGELGAASCGGLDSAIAVCPPIDLAICSRNIGQGANRIYDRHFVRNLTGAVRRLRRLRPDAPGTALSRRARTLADFDDLYTAPVSGFGSAQNYYHECSSKPLLAKIRWPTLILASEDDPLIPYRIFASRLHWAPRTGRRPPLARLADCRVDRLAPLITLWFRSKPRAAGDHFQLPLFPFIRIRLRPASNGGVLAANKRK
jgi:hypothetical protein